MVGIPWHELMQCCGKRCLLTAIFLLAIGQVNLHAQKVRHDLVLLKNGEMVKGVILSRDAEKGIRIESSCGIRVIALAELDTIVEGDANSKRFSTVKGFYNLSSLTLLFGEGEDGFVPLPSLTTTFGYQLTNSTMVGAGLGFEYYKWPVLPLYTEARYLLRDDDILLPWVSLRAGGSLPLVSKYDGGGYYGWVSEGKTYGGLMINPETGVWVPLSRTTGLSVSAGYHHQRLSHDEPLIDWRFGTQIGTKRVYTYYNRINLRLGLYFK